MDNTSINTKAPKKLMAIGSKSDVAIRIDPST
jgi:hypothetical protein